MIYMDIETTEFDGAKFEIIGIYMLKEDADGDKIDEMHYSFKPSKTLKYSLLYYVKIEKNSIYS